jgi:hypothetical protein
MTLDNLIAASYGSEDCIFAGHELDRQRALKSLTAANNEEVGFAEFLEKHRQYLISRQCSLEHIEEQLQRVQTLDLYFSLD